MKIYSWNMLFMNRELDRAFSFIRDTDFDVLCLQEVPEVFLERLKTLPFHIAYTIDVERLVPNPQPIYLVTLSRNPIIKQERIPFPDYRWNTLPVRTRIFVRLMRPFHFAKIQNRGCLFTDISINGTTIRVFNLHLILAQPAWRLREFETAMAVSDTKYPTIVCGDFNIIESIFMSPLNWLLSGTLSDALLYSRERTVIESSFSKHGLTNVLLGKCTHSFARSQLDHILLSNSFVIKQSKVLTNRNGSDHHPIYVEVTPLVLDHI